MDDKYVTEADMMEAASRWISLEDYFRAKGIHDRSADGPFEAIRYFMGTRGYSENAAVGALQAMIYRYWAWNERTRYFDFDVIQNAAANAIAGNIAQMAHDTLR